MTAFVVWKKPGMILLLAFCFLHTYGQDEADAVEDIRQYRARQEATFKAKKKSPLLPADRRKFKGLNYYPINLKYRVKARFTRNENPVLFRMKTTTERLPEYTKYGEVTFVLDGETYRLEVYQSPEIMQRPGYEDYLFIPFTDLTNGDDTYDVGRYVEMTIPAAEEVTVDFNKAYNPYCSYSPRFSCPIPPEANQLAVAIMAGEKKYKQGPHASGR
jgi:uncharacterized protein (DUF1684 family)